MLCILDGLGYRAEVEHNAVALARTPTLDRLAETCPNSLLRTDGNNVGLPEGQFGNSEVGHMNLGAGRIVMQDLPRIDAAIADGSLATAPALRKLIVGARQASGRVHLLGLVSPGGVHSHQAHIAALTSILVNEGLQVIVHGFFDGRDTPPKSALSYVEQLERMLEGVSGWQFGTAAGRYFAMDRDNRWERVEAAYNAIVMGTGPRVANIGEGIASAYSSGHTDEFIEPFVLGSYAGAIDGDAILCANFRADRVRQLLRALVDETFDGFKRDAVRQWSELVGMTEYSDDLCRRMRTIFPRLGMSHLLGEVIAVRGLKQLRAAETEKYPHVTFFFNGGREAPFSGEERILVASPKVATYDQQPEMSANELTDKVVKAVSSDSFDFVLINYANADMVGHTGVESAAIRAVETVDQCVGKLADAVERAGGAMIVTADHGNCEMMVDPETGVPHTAHTLNPVPCFLLFADAEAQLANGRLADIAPTILDLMSQPKPPEMTGTSLIRRS